MQNSTNFLVVELNVKYEISILNGIWFVICAWKSSKKIDRFFSNLLYNFFFFLSLFFHTYLPTFFLRWVNDNKLTFPHPQCSAQFINIGGKVWVFWEGHKIWKNLCRTFDKSMVFCARNSVLVLAKIFFLNADTSYYTNFKKKMRPIWFISPYSH